MQRDGTTSPNPPLEDASIHSNDRMNAFIGGNKRNVSLRECALPPENLPRTPPTGETKKSSSHKELRRHPMVRRRARKRKLTKNEKVIEKRRAKDMGSKMRREYGKASTSRN